MNLQDVIDQLSGSELSNLFVFDDDVGTIDVPSRTKLIPQLNLGMQLLYSRFFLKEGTEVVNMTEGVYTYPLSNTDVLRIEKVEDIAGNEYLLDVEGEPESLMRPNLRTLKTPEAMEPMTLIVTYRAVPPKLSTADAAMEPIQVDVDLPYTYMEPLTLFIASRFMNPMGASEGFHEGNNYASRYEAACRQLEMQNYDLDRHDDNNHFHNAGWV
jgi:hypothetical protein